MKSKVCRTCKKPKPLTREFYHYDRLKKDGFQGACIKCRKLKEKFGSRLDNYKKHFNVPDCIVYGIVKDGEVLYVGSSTQAPYRLYNHFNRKNHRTFFKNISVEDRIANYKVKVLAEVNEKSKLIETEIALIQSLNPKWNKHHKKCN